MTLQTPLKDAGRVYKMYATKLEKLGIYTLEDFLYHVPTRYEDFSLISKIAMVQPGEIITVIGQVLEMKNEFTRNYKKIQKATIADETGDMHILWFNQPYLTQYIKKNDTIALSGRAEQSRNGLSLTSPDFEVLNDGKTDTMIHTGRLVPIYHETRGVSSKWLRRQIYKLLEDHKDELTEYMPESIITKENMYFFPEAIRQAHFPTSMQTALKAKERLAFDELFFLQIASLRRRSEWEKSLKGNAFHISQHKGAIEKFWEALPFTLIFLYRRLLTLMPKSTSFMHEAIIDECLL